MKRWVAAASIAALMVVGTPLAAAADESECAGNAYTDSGYEYLRIDRHLVPPPMRALPWDCAIRPAGDEFVEQLLPDGRYVQSVQYAAFYVGMGYDEFVAFIRAWESSGYAAVGEINIVDDGSGPRSVDFGADDLAALDPAPGFVNARFSNGPEVPAPSRPGANIYEFQWTDGTGFDSRFGIEGVPILFASVILTEPYLDGTGLDDPSALSNLRTIQDAAPTPGQWAVIGTG